MTDTLKPTSPEWQKRQDRWYHNAFRGHCGMMKANLRAIINAHTTTLAAKELAFEMLKMAEELDMLVRKRVERK